MSASKIKGGSFAGLDQDFKRNDKHCHALVAVRIFKWEKGTFRQPGTSERIS